MPGVLITGAGYVGNALAFELRRKGYDVYALVRSEEKAKKLEAREIKPLLGDVLKLETYEPVLQKVDVVVNTAQGSFDNPSFEETVFNHITSSVKKSVAAGHPKKRLIFSSGGLVYASNPNAILTEDAPLTDKGLPFLATRIRIEQAVIQFTDAYSTVLRLPLVLGGENGHRTTFFKQAEEGKVVIPGDGKNRGALAHIDDIVESYVKVIEADPHLVAGQIFNIASDTAPTVEEVAKAFAEAAGFHGPFEHGPPEPFFNVNIVFDSSKAKRVLGWKPSRPDLIKEAPILYKAWKAGGYPVVF